MDGWMDRTGQDKSSLEGWHNSIIDMRNKNKQVLWLLQLQPGHVLLLWSHCGITQREVARLLLVLFVFTEEVYLAGSFFLPAQLLLQHDPAFKTEAQMDTSLFKLIGSAPLFSRPKSDPFLYASDGNLWRFWRLLSVFAIGSDMEKWTGGSRNLFKWK